MVRPLVTVVALLSWTSCVCSGPTPGGGGSGGATGASGASDEGPWPDTHPLLPDTTAKAYGSGFGWVGGLTAQPDGTVFFGDTRGLKVHRVDLKGDTTQHYGDSGAAAGLAFDAQGRLYAAEEHSRRVTRRQGDKIDVLAEAWAGERLNGPKDVAVDAKGGVYFTDPAFPRPGKGEMNAETEGLYYIPATGPMRRLDDDLGRPTGLALTRDGKTLYVADLADAVLYRYDVQADGGVTGRSAFKAGLKRVDDVALDAQGNVWIASVGGLRTFTKDGKKVGRVTLKRKPSSLAFGGADGKMLFVTLGVAGVRSFSTTVAGAAFATEAPPAAVDDAAAR